MGWIPQTATATTPLFCAAFNSATTGLVAGQNGWMFRTSDAGLNWVPVKRASNNSIYGISFADNGVGVAVGDHGTILRTTNGGGLWDDRSITPAQPTTYSFSGVACNSSGVGIIVGKIDTMVGSGIPETRGLILRSIDAGSMWTRQIGLWNRALNDVSIGGSQTAMSVGDSGFVLRSTDKGLTWTELPRPTAMCLNGVCVFGSTTAIIVGDSGTILRTDDGGMHWVKQASGTSSRLTSVWMSGLNSAFVVGEHGTILRSIDGGSKWIPQFSGTSSALMGTAFNGTDLAIVVGDRGSIIRTLITEIPTTVRRLEGSVLPLHFTLEQNYPNPFNPTTSISYQLPSSTFVDMRIFDVLGREVAVLVREMRRQGIHVVRWDASAMPSGVYFCRLDAGSMVLTRKMVLVR